MWQLISYIWETLRNREKCQRNVMTVRHIAIYYINQYMYSFSAHIILSSDQIWWCICSRHVVRLVWMYECENVICHCIHDVRISSLSRNCESKMRQRREKKIESGQCVSQSRSLVANGLFKMRRFPSANYIIFLLVQSIIL